MSGYYRDSAPISAVFWDQRGSASFEAVGYYRKPLIISVKNMNQTATVSHQIPCQSSKEIKVRHF